MNGFRKPGFLLASRHCEQGMSEQQSHTARRGVRLKTPLLVETFLTGRGERKLSNRFADRVAVVAQVVETIDIRPPPDVYQP